MQKTEILKEIFDKNVVAVMKTFASNSEQHFSLSQVSFLSNVKVTTTLRIINKLIEKDVLKVRRIGKSKFYQWEDGEKSAFLLNLLRRTDDLVSK